MIEMSNANVVMIDYEEFKSLLEAKVILQQAERYIEAKGIDYLDKKELRAILGIEEVEA